MRLSFSTLFATVGVLLAADHDETPLFSSLRDECTVSYAICVFSLRMRLKSENRQ